MFRKKWRAELENKCGSDMVCALEAVEEKTGEFKSFLALPSGKSKLFRKNKLLENLKNNNTIIFPSRINHKTVAEVCSQISAICKNTRNRQKIIFDARDLTFIDALSMTVLFNHIADIKSQGWDTRLMHFRNEHGDFSRAIAFMDDSEFFLKLSGKRLCDSSSCRNTTLPIRRLKPNETVMWLHNDAVPWLAKRLGVTEDSLVEIRICIEELFNNIKDHSGTPNSSIFIQHYPQLKKFRICMSDNGIGLLQKIQRIHPEFNHRQTVEHALQEGFTTRSSHRNAGMGLFTLTKTVCNNGGMFVLRTGKIHALITGDEGQTRIEYLENLPDLQGTAFEITLYDKHLDLEQAQAEDFVWD